MGFSFLFLPQLTVAGIDSENSLPTVAMPVWISPVASAKPLRSGHEPQPPSRITAANSGPVNLNRLLMTKSFMVAHLLFGITELDVYFNCGAISVCVEDF